MKKIILAFACCIFSFITFAQNADTTYTYVWLNNTYQLGSRSFNTYGSGCVLDITTTQTFNPITQGWLNASRSLYSYDGTLFDTITNQTWSLLGNRWNNSQRTFYTYNGQGQITVATSQTYSGGSWTNLIRQTYTFDAGGHTTQVLTEQWKNNAWVNYQLVVYNNNSNGSVKYFITQQWNTTSTSWDNFDSVAYTYDGSKIATVFSATWVVNTWVNSTLITYTYDGNGYNTESVIQTYNVSTSTWVNSIRTTNTYTNGNLSETVIQLWDEGSMTWTNQAKEDFIYSSGCALPLTLLSFTATKSNNNVMLQWKTANEVNTSKFIVQRSTNATNFADVETIKANPNSGTVNYYSFTDNIANISANKIYYRLKMLDNDGKNSLSQVVPISLSNIIKFAIKPNPAKNYFILQGDATTASVQLNIFDYSGRSVLAQKIILNGEQKIDISKLPKGAYMVNIRTADNVTTTQKLVVQ